MHSSTQKVNITIHASNSTVFIKVENAIFALLTRDMQISYPNRESKMLNSPLNDQQIRKSPLIMTWPVKSNYTVHKIIFYDKFYKIRQAIIDHGIK